MTIFVITWSKIEIKNQERQETSFLGMHIYDHGVNIGFVSLKEIADGYQDFQRESKVIYTRWDADPEWREQMVMECLL